MMITELNPGGRNKPSRLRARHAFARTLTNRNDQLRLGSSVRLPVTPENRLHLRALRQAELQAWNRGPRTSVNAALRKEVARAAQGHRYEFRAFAAVVFTAAVAITLGVLALARFLEQHADFVASVRQLLGLS